jgi:predicted acyl esterase
MKTPLWFLLLAAAFFASASAQDRTEEQSPGYAVRAETGIMVRMRDGVRLSTDLFFPVGAEGKLPVILWRSVYGKEGAFEREALLPELVKRGYVVATQATRGRGGSEGSFIPLVGDRKDGYDTVAWLASQLWSNQKVGTAGCSSLGEAQLLLAVSMPPHLVTIVPMSAASAYNVHGRPWMSFDNVQEGALRMRPGEVYAIQLNLHATSNYFGPGHRFRLEVSSSNFPRWDRNLNTGGNNFDESKGITARNTIHHSTEHPSYIVLPVVE